MASKSSSGRKCQWRSGRSRSLDNDEVLTILNAVVDFRSRNGGRAPTPTTVKPVFDAVKGSLKRPDVTIDQLYNKLRNLKNLYHRAVDAGVGPTPFDRKFYDLSVKAWGEKMKTEEVGSDSDDDRGNEEEEGKGKVDACGCFKYLTHQARKYWEMEGMPMSSLELGLKFMDKTKAAALERRWRLHLESEMKILVRSLDAEKDLNVALVVAVQKGPSL